MIRPPKQRHWSLIGCLPGWSRRTWLVVAAFWLAPLVTLVVGGSAKSELAAGLVVLAMAVVHVVVYRHGGWGLLGPHFYYDVVRLARRGRSTVLRVVYIVGIFLGLWLVYRTMPKVDAMRINDFAAAAEQFAFALFQVQNLAVLILAPAYLGSAIAEERERRTLELLFTTQLSDREIILGKLFSRIIHLVGFVLAGWPILCLILFWGGIDLMLIAGNVANTLLLIMSVGSFCLLLSTVMRSVTAAVVTAYAILAPTAFCCVTGLSGFPLVLHDARTGTGHMVTVQDLPTLLVDYGLVTIACLVLAWLSLRGREYFDVASLPMRPHEGLLRQEIATAVVALGPTHDLEPGAEDLFAVPYVLPPVTDNPLLWKERHVGGPSLLTSPVMLVPMLPFLLTGVATLGFWFLIALNESDQEFERSRRAGGLILRFFYYVFLGCYVLSASFRASSSVARERQQQTLEPLLLLPIERRDILAAKWLAALLRGWPWPALMLGDILFGVWLGAYHPTNAVMLGLAPWPMVAFFTTFGLLLSVLMSTVLRAYLAMVVAIVMMAGCTLFGMPVLSYLEALVIPSRLPDVDATSPVMVGVLAMAGYTVLAAMCWFLAVRRFEDRARHDRS